MEEKKWYAIQTYSGSEAFVKETIIRFASENALEHKIGEVAVPTEKLIDTKKGEQKIVEKSLYSGYVFAELDLDLSLWQKIQSLPKVSKFISEGKKPTPLSTKDVELILKKTNEEKAPRPKIFFEPNETVRIKEGSFANFNGVVEEYDVSRGLLTLNVSIFGRNTPVEMLYNQVEKIV
jgi:transcriptional antiterminator NusG